MSIIKNVLDSNDVSGILSTHGLLTLWDFNKNDAFVSKGRFEYELLQSDNNIKIENEGPLSGGSVRIEQGQYLYIPRVKCPGLNISGSQAKVTVCAWIKRETKSVYQCEAIAGMWNETGRKRQYCLFLNISLYDSANQVAGHISSHGGPTAGNKWCIDVAIGNTIVPYGEWQFVAFTYDSKMIRSYINGRFDEREGCNPYFYDEGIFDGGSNGSDFTVGAVDRLGEMGNDFVGLIGGVAVFDRALTEKELYDLYKNQAY